MAVFRNVIELVINPFFISLVLLGLSAIFVLRGTHVKFVKITLPVIFIILFTISTSWLPDYMTKKMGDEYQYVSQIDNTINWVVVLGGGQVNIKNANDIPANELLLDNSIERLIEGVRLYRMLPHSKLLLSGGGSAPVRPVAKNMAILAKWFAIPEQDLVIESDSLNTADQVRKIKPIVQEQPFYLVTSSTHLPRAMVLFKQAGLHPVAAPSDVAISEQTDWIGLLIPNVNNMVFTSTVIHELLGSLWIGITKAHL